MQPQARDWRADGAAPRAAGDFAVGLGVCGFLIAAVVGLPLFEDGSFYFFSIVTEQVPVVPNLRVSAVLPQLPTVAAFSLGADLALGRLIFSAAYMAIPLATLVGSWLLLRGRAPALLLLVLPSFLALQLNFSGVSELLTGLYLTWPLLLAMLLLPQRRWVLGVAIAWGPLLLLLHPLTFIFCFGLALLAWLVSRAPCAQIGTTERIAWRWIGLWLVANGLARVAWTAFGLNDYERGRLEPSNALSYLFGETTAQHLLIGILVCVTLFSAWMLRPCQRPAQSARVLLLLLWSALLVSGWVSAEFLLGQGIVLKSAMTLAVGLLGMAAVTWLLPRWEAGRGALCGGLPARAVRLLGVALLMLLLARSSAWWTGVRGLQDIVASSDAACIRFGADEPYSLQWPWMVITDSWSTPFTALVTRPFVPTPEGDRPQPIAVMLKHDGCEQLLATGILRLPVGIGLPFEAVDAVLGPLRRPGPLAQ